MGTIGGDMKILFLTPNQELRWNNGHDLFQTKNSGAT